MSNIYDGSGYDCSAIKSLLKEAQEAYHALITGTKTVSIERNGRKVTYSETNIQQLSLYIQNLQANLSSTSGRQRSPARMVF